MKDIQVTLYDVFGYIFPGATFLAAMFLGYWTAFLPLDQDLTKLTGAGWIFVLMVAYVSGHLVQALANLVARLRPSNVDLVLDPSTGTIPTEVVQAAHARARALIGSPQDVNLAAQTVFEICDHYVQKEGETATRDMYVYRKGFYRGMAVALLSLAPALIARACLMGASINAFGIEHRFTVSQLLVLAIASSIFSLFFFQRYRRFGSYLVKNAVYGALVIESNNKE